MTQRCHDCIHCRCKIPLIYKDLPARMSNKKANILLKYPILMGKLDYKHAVIWCRKNRWNRARISGLKEFNRQKATKGKDCTDFERM